VFIEVGAEWRQLYAGQWLPEWEVEVRFISSYMPYVPHTLGHLRGLMGAFQGLFPTARMNDLQISMQQTFSRTDYDDDDLWRFCRQSSAQKFPDDHTNLLLLLLRSKLPPSLQVGPRYDPLESISLHVCFDSISGDAIAAAAVAAVSSTAADESSENNEHIDALITQSLTPWQADRWLLRAEFDPAEDDWRCLSNLSLFPLVQRLILGWFEATTVRSAAAEDHYRAFGDGGGNSTRPQHRSIGKAMLSALLRGGNNATAVSSGQGTSLVDRAQVVEIILAAFRLPRRKFELPGTPLATNFLVTWMPRYRSVPYTSLLWVLVRGCLNVLHGSPGQQKHLIPSPPALMAAVWADFIKLIRHHWELKHPISGLLTKLSINDQGTQITLEQADDVDDGAAGIDLRQSLVQQKLQMLQICIRKLRPAQPNRPPMDLEQLLKPSNTVQSSKSAAIAIGNSILTTAANDIVTATLAESSNQANNSVQAETPPMDNDAYSASSDDDDDDGGSGEVFYDTVDKQADTDEDFFMAERTPSMPSGSFPGRARLASFASSFENVTMDSSRLDITMESEDHEGQLIALTGNTNGGGAGNNYSDDSDTEEQLPLDTKQRHGHLRPHGDCKLTRTGEQMFVPVTQDHGHMTEDMLREMEQLFERLGTSEDAARIRAKMQSANLKSGM
jgi:hypothetical protein